jgi:hypothetical protein
LLFSVQSVDRFVLHVLSIDDGKPAPFGGIESARPIGAVFSPDGRWIAYGYSQAPNRGDENSGVYVQPFPATGARYQVPKQPASIDFHPLWGPAGSELLYVLSVGSGQFGAVTFTTAPAVAFGNPLNIPARVTAGRTSAQMRAHDILPDGRFVGLIPDSGPNSSDLVSPGPEMRIVLNWFEELKRRVPVN